MSTLGLLTFAVLVILICVEGIVIREALSEIVALQRLYGGALSNRRLPGSNMPHFNVPLLGTARRLRRSDLNGAPTMLLFVSPREAPQNTGLTAAIHALWHKSEGHLYIVCQDDEEQCRSFAEDHKVCSLPEVSVLLDTTAHISRRLRLRRTPSAVMLDSHGRVARYGIAIDPEETSSRFAESGATK